MSVIGATLRAQRATEARMTDQCVVRRPTGRMVENPDWTVSPEYEVVYDPAAGPHHGKCYVTGDRPYESSVVAGEATRISQRVTVVFPATSGPFEPGDIITILGSSLQRHLMGRSYRVAGPDERSHQSSQRMFVDFDNIEEVPPWTP